MSAFPLGLPFLQETVLANVVATTLLPSSGFPLAGGGTVTFNAFGISGLTRAAGYVFTNQPGTLFVEQSIDGVNFDIQSATAVVANVAALVNQLLVGTSARVRFLNTGGLQTFFRGNIVARPL